MKYEKIVCWGADPEFQRMVSEEFTSSELILVLTLDDFKNAVTNSSLNLISSSNFNDFATDGFTVKVQAFIQSRPELEFNILAFAGRNENSALCCGYLWQEKNVEVRLIMPKFNGTIEALLQVSFREDQL